MLEFLKTLKILITSNESFIDVILSIVTVVISIVAICISIKTQRHQLKIDLFEKRYNCFKEIDLFINKCINGESVEKSDILTYTNMINSSKFIFSKKIFLLFEKTIDYAWEIETAQSQVKSFNEYSIDESTINKIKSQRDIISIKRKELHNLRDQLLSMLEKQLSIT